MIQKLLLASSKSVFKQITDIFDFVWPTAAAMWNLRWQVDGYIRAHSSATDPELNGRFVSGSSISGANLRKACILTSWSAQQETFAKFLLVDLCTLYESWADVALEELRVTSHDGKSLQFPNPNGGVPNSIVAINDTPSLMMSTSIYPALVAHRKNSLKFINELLICYRYFKECRNSIIHNNGRASPRLVAAYTSYSVLTAASLGLSEAPEHDVAVLGQRISLKLRGVVGFGEVILRLIATLDAELARSHYAERTFVDRWKSLHSKSRFLPAKRTADRYGTIKRLVQSLGLPSPRALPTLEAFLVANSLVV